MISALNIAATGMNVSVDEINNVAQNLSNLQTTAFKSMMLVSSDLSYQTKTPAGVTRQEGGNPAPVGIQFGSGAKTAAVFRIIKQGDITSTGDPLHLAIDGAGYFKVLVGGKEFFTRSGAFKRDPKSGYLVTNEGYEVVPQIQLPLTINDDVFQIDKNGNVQTRADQSTQWSNTGGQIQLFTFPNESGLEAVGGTLFAASPDGSGPEIAGKPGIDPGVGILTWKSLEQSTVDAVEELTHAIAAQRAYELNSKIIKIADEMLNSANQIK